jgi:hypothetical protein
MSARSRAKRSAKNRSNRGSISGGHCHAIQKSGPFVIGKDFEAPTPAVRILPKIKLPANVLKKLMDCLVRGHPSRNAASADPTDHEYFADAVAELKVQNGVREALAWYASDYGFQPHEKKIRDEIKLLQKCIKRFKSRLPSKRGALGNFISRSYTGELFLRRKLRPSKEDLTALQEAWGERFGFESLREILEVMLQYTSAAELCLGKNKPRNHRVLALVRDLAILWQELTGKWPKSGRDPNRFKQMGPFARFVRIATDVLPKELRPKSLDVAIRQTCDTRIFPRSKVST